MYVICKCVNITNVLFINITPRPRQTQMREKGRMKLEQVKQKICWSCSFHSNTQLWTHFSHFCFDKAKEIRYLSFFPTLSPRNVCSICVLFLFMGTDLYLYYNISPYFPFLHVHDDTAQTKVHRKKTATYTMICGISMQCGVFVCLCKCVNADVLKIVTISRCLLNKINGWDYQNSNRTIWYRYR